MDIIKLKKLLIEHEGYRLDLYQDTKGFLTAGIGHLMTKKDGPLVLGRKVTAEQVNLWFESDIQMAILIAKSYLGAAWNTLSEERKIVLVDMCFNLGPKINKFVDFKAALVAGDYVLAVKSMQDSLWATQVPTRAKSLAKIMESGKL